MKAGFARQYGEFERWHWWFRGRRRILETLMQRALPTGRRRSILTLGCGPAAELGWLVSFAEPGGRVIGLDRDAVHAASAPVHVEFVVGSAERLPFATASFDVALALDVVEHLDDDVAGLREAIRVVKPGGVLFVTVPALPSLWGQQDIVSEHRRRYTRRTFKRLMEASGITQYRMTYFNSVLFPAIASIRWARRVLRRPDVDRSDFESGRPGVVNDTLALLFGLERHVIDWMPLPIGVSLVAECKVGKTSTLLGGSPS